MLGVGEVYVQPFDWEGADLMEPVKVCHHLFVLSMFFFFLPQKFSSFAQQQQHV